MIPVKPFAAYIYEDNIKRDERSLTEQILDVANSFLFKPLKKDKSLSFLLEVDYKIDKVLWSNNICVRSDCGIGEYNELIIKFKDMNGNTVYLNELDSKDVFCFVIR